MDKKKSRDDARTKRLKKFGFKKVAFSAEEREKFRQELAPLFSTKQEVVFSNNISENNDIGIRPDILEEIIKKHVPIVSNTGSTLTTKRIIDVDYIRRIGGLSSMLVLIKVSFSGLISEECWKRGGFYVLRLDPQNDGYAVKVKELGETELIYEGDYVLKESEKSSQATIDYRDILAKIISENYSSKYQFCKATGIDEAFLSNVLRKKKHFSLKNLEDILEKIGYKIDMVKK